MHEVNQSKLSHLNSEIYKKKSMIIKAQHVNTRETTRTEMAPKVVTSPEKMLFPPSTIPI